MKSDIAGRVRNTPSFKSKPLLPLFEAVINSFQSIREAALGQSGSITVLLEREPLLIEETGLGRISSVSVTDNGVGFSDRHFESFNTADSMLKASQGGRGVGRFSWLVAFDRVEVTSVFHDGELKRRSFPFTRTGDPIAEQQLESMEAEPQLTTIRMVDLRTPYLELWPIDADAIAQRVIEHCLLCFFDEDRPTVRLIDGDRLIDLNDDADRYRREFSSDTELDVDGKKLRLVGVRLYDTSEKDHRLHLAANLREVKSFKLEQFIPNLAGKIDHGEHGNFLYCGYVTGDYLDSNVSADRAHFEIAETEAEQLDGRLIRETSLEAIRSAAIDEIRLELAEFLTEIDSKKEARIIDLVQTEAPEYRVLMPDLPGFLDKVSPTASKARIEEFLNDELHRKRKAVRESVRSFLHEEEPTIVGNDYLARGEEIMERLTEIDKSALAAHVTHRRLILDLLERSIKRNQETGQYELEKAVHSLVFPMRKSSTDVWYEDQHMWIIDERLSYHTVVFSDKQLRAMPELNSSSLTRPDIAVFDVPFMYREGDPPLNSIVVVEFKRPGWDSTGSGDPTAQALNQIREIKEGLTMDGSGRPISPVVEAIPATAYVICDLTKKVRDQLLEKDYSQTPDGMGYFYMHKGLKTYLEVISYDKLLADAKKRNSILFAKLGIRALPGRE